MKYRLRTPTHVGEWRPTRAAAEDDAIALKLGHREEWSGRFYAEGGVKVEIEREEDE